MNNITVEHLLELVSQIIPGSTYDYARPGANKARLISVDIASTKIQIARVSGDGTLTQSSIASDSLNTLASRIVEDTPISIDEALLNGGNQRSVVEALLLRTAEFYSCKVGRNKNIVWVPSRPHKIGEHIEINLSDLHPDNYVDSILDDISELFATYLKNEGKSEATIDRYVKQVPNNSEVQNVVQSVAGTTALFDVMDVAKLLQISQKVAAQDFDQKGGNMYSAGINAFAHFVSNYYLFLKYIARNNKNTLVHIPNPSNHPLQQIFYGAPGTGKSHKIDGETNDDNSIRTTFHPDTDYATFVGAYKPMMEETEVRVVPVVLNNGASFDQNNGTYKEKRIVYKYEPQAFLKAYVEAWKRYLNRQEGEDDSYYLVIEEINRGNCAQIFGDLFQLLDRENDGYSGYAISPESAITKYLAEEAQSADGTKFSDLVFSDVIKKREDETETETGKIIATAADLKAGRRLVLPPNLHIWATMNTSDQSLFPIDSAFKRRWDWEYVPIKRADKEPENKWIIKVTHGDKTYWCYWWEFLEAINHQIEETNHSEDKQLGYFFAKPKAGENFISADTFVNKVIFYLWNDVFKDEDSAVFQYDNDKVEDVSINRSGTMYFRHFMENKDEMIHYFINQLFAMGKENNPVVPIDYLKNDADSKVIEHLPKMREGAPVKLDDEAVDEETSEDNGISVRKSDNIDKIVFSIPEYKKMSEKLTQALKGNVFKYSKNSMDMKMGDMPISYARLSMAYSSKKTDIKLYIPAKSVYNQSIECYKYMNSKGVEDIIAEVSERNNLDYELISKDIAENKVLGWRITYPMTFSESGDNIMDGYVTKIVEIVKELQEKITPIMNEFSKNGK